MAQNNTNKEQKLFQTLKDDIRKGGFTSSLGNEFTDVKEFFITEERKKQLEGMGSVKSFFLTSWWLLKELLFKLTPIRRMLLVVGMFLMLTTGKIGINGGDSFVVSRDTSIFGGIIILFILMLELRDKLLAKDELTAGKSVQSALTPKRTHKIPGWQVWLYTNSANDVGGDLVDIIELNNNKHGITIADVSGKGLGAALLMAKLQTIIRAFAPDYFSLSKLGEKINNSFFKDILPNSFASMIYFQISEESNSIEILNAGHLPPLLLQDEKVTELSKGNVALGLANDSTYKTEKLELKNDDILIAFSDGLTEARNLEGRFYGTEIVKNLLKFHRKLSPEEMGNKIVAHVNMYIGDAKVHDDLSVVILKRE
jgi:hypothetical protein